MNALFGSEAKRFLLGVRVVDQCWRFVRHGGFDAKFDARLEGGFQRLGCTQTAVSWKSKAVGVAGLQGVDAEMLWAIRVRMVSIWLMACAPQASFRDGVGVT